MEYRSFDLTILSAEDLKRVPRFGKMSTYAIAWVLPYERQSTPLDTAGGTKPVWNHKLIFSAPDSAFQQPNSHLTIEIHSRGTLSKNFVGSVFVPLADILRATGEERLTYQVKRRSGRARGLLNVSVRLGDKTTADATTKAYGAGSSSNTPVMAYPAGGYGYGNQRQGAYPPDYGGQGYPPQYPSAYPPQGYAPQYYPQVQQPTRPGRRPGFGGAGLGTGLMAGALGGLLVGDMIGDMSGGYDNYGGGYDDGGYDGGGFDGGGFDGGF